MKNAIIQSIEDGYLKKDIPEFAPGDNLKIKVKIVEGTNTRIQNYEGVCIARKNAGIGSSFTVRKISYGEGVERVFPLYSPVIEAIEVIRRGKVRRAKLYYLRNLRGKAARIVEKVNRKIASDDASEAKKNIKAKAETKATTEAPATENSTTDDKGNSTKA